jgi:pimeloyl-ACP methyl ester carboxylesterase
MKYLLPAIFVFFSFLTRAQDPAYPYPVNYHLLLIEGQDVKMAYMDVAPDHPNGRAVLLFHGKNFNGYYWKDVIPWLAAAGYRVIVPDQVGWGFSDKPALHYSFHLLSANTKSLLDSLRIKKVSLIAHSMGGMLGTRFALMYPSTVESIVFENPIGLEDYRIFVPYQLPDSQYANELKSNYESLRKYQQSYYPEWKPEYDQYVAAQLAALQIPNFRQAALASALTYQMIYEQPVVYEFERISQPALLIIGQADRTIVGKNLLPKDSIAKHGNYPALGKELHKKIRHSRLAELPGVGHIPHIQSPDAFRKLVLDYLKTGK